MYGKIWQFGHVGHSTPVVSNAASNGKFFDAVDVPLIEMSSILIRRGFVWVDPWTIGKVYRDLLYLALLMPPTKAVWPQRLKA